MIDVLVGPNATKQIPVTRGQQPPDAKANFKFQLLWLYCTFT